MGGRDDLIDIAVSKSRSGYMQRRLVSALEDLKLTADGTVRNTAGTVVQFLYGEDGVDPSKAVRGKAIDLNDLFFEVLGDDFEDHLLHDIDDPYEEFDYIYDDELEYIEDEEYEDDLGFDCDAKNEQ